MLLTVKHSTPRGSGLEIAAALLKLYPGRISLEADRALIGNAETIRAPAAGEDPEAIRQRQQRRYAAISERSREIPALSLK